MIKNVIINNNKNLPIRYSYKLESLKNRTKNDTTYMCYSQSNTYI